MCWLATGSLQTSSPIRENKERYILFHIWILVHTFRLYYTLLGFPVGSVIKSLPANAGDTRDRFHPWVKKLPRGREWQPTPVFLPGKSYEQRSLGAGGLQSTGSKRLRHNWATEHACLPSKPIQNCFPLNLEERTDFGWWLGEIKWGSSLLVHIYWTLALYKTSWRENAEEGGAIREWVRQDHREEVSSFPSPQPLQTAFMNIMNYIYKSQLNSRKMEEVD